MQQMQVLCQFQRKSTNLQFPEDGQMKHCLQESRVVKSVTGFLTSTASAADMSGKVPHAVLLNFDTIKLV